jgi:hypothetical protein
LAVNEWTNYQPIGEQMLVETIKGLLPIEDLEVKDIVTVTDNSRCIATEYYYNGELVKRSAWADIFRAVPLIGEQPKLA